MSAFIFICDSITEQECLDRMLFGTNPSDVHLRHYSKMSPGDAVFLYNLDSGILRGPFSALTRCTLNIEPTAWRKSNRSFPWQVRVDGGNTFGTSLSADELSRMSLLKAT